MSELVLLIFRSTCVGECWNSAILHGHSGSMETLTVSRMRTLLTGQVWQIKLLISTLLNPLKDFYITFILFNVSTQ